MIEPTPDKISYLFCQIPSAVDHCTDVDFCHSMPKVDKIEKLTNARIMLNDMMNKIDNEATNMFTRGLHHRNVSVVFVVQNFVNKNKHLRMINVQYIMLF